MAHQQDQRQSNALIIEEEETPAPAPAPAPAPINRPNEGVEEEPWKFPRAQSPPQSLVVRRQAHETAHKIIQSSRMEFEIDQVLAHPFAGQMSIVHKFWLICAAKLLRLGLPPKARPISKELTSPTMGCLKSHEFPTLACDAWVTRHKSVASRCEMFIILTRLAKKMMGWDQDEDVLTVDKFNRWWNKVVAFSEKTRQNEERWFRDMLMQPAWTDKEKYSSEYERCLDVDSRERDLPEGIMNVLPPSLEVLRLLAICPGYQISGKSRAWIEDDMIIYGIRLPFNALFVPFPSTGVLSAQGLTPGVVSSLPKANPEPENGEQFMVRRNLTLPPPLIPEIELHEGQPFKYQVGFGAEPSPLEPQERCETNSFSIYDTNGTDQSPLSINYYNHHIGSLDPARTVLLPKAPDNPDRFFRDEQGKQYFHTFLASKPQMRTQPTALETALNSGIRSKYSWLAHEASTEPLVRGNHWPTLHRTTGPPPNHPAFEDVNQNIDLYPKMPGTDRYYCRCRANGKQICIQGECKHECCQRGLDAKQKKRSLYKEQSSRVKQRPVVLKQMEEEREAREKQEQARLKKMASEAKRLEKAKMQTRAERGGGEEGIEVERNKEITRKPRRKMTEEEKRIMLAKRGATLLRRKLEAQQSKEPS
ncbi:hypothetical protein BS50DRAFT_591467 [Corynespora cassiicola Philippines]|uniref:Uncharacterized protein n=1 Tax=Corynespora cassiicola Philippines TaxID=1448308 RepID=A0A2T2NCZ3_CORCC|nr:hypothetical protein BS50DRAFT_591467 [Corynespora cassiicola Philippines]